MLELQLERQKRLQLERQLEEETARRGELVEQEIRLRERQKVQVRNHWDHPHLLIAIAVCDLVKVQCELAFRVCSHQAIAFTIVCDVFGCNSAISHY